MNERTLHVTIESPAALAPLSGWDVFERDMASALSVLKDEFLIISAKVGNRFIQFNARPDEGVFCEAVSNSYLDPSEKLDATQVAALAALGWSAPTRGPNEPPPAIPPRGSPNFFREFPSPFSCLEIARFAVRTLSEVHHIAGPRALEYKAFDEPGNQVTLPALHIDRASPPAPRGGPKHRGPAPFARLRAKVLAAARLESGDSTLEYDDGSLSIPIGKRIGTLTPYSNPTFVRLFCMLVSKPEIDEDLMRRLHQINTRLALGRLILVPNGVFLAIDFPAAPFHAAHLHQAANCLAKIADDVANDVSASDDEPGGTRVVN